MSIKEFAESVRTEVEKQTGREVKLLEVTKNNGVVLHGLKIVEPKVNIIPTIYLEPFHKEYENGRRLEEIAKHICEIFQRDKVPASFSMEWFRDFEMVKGKVAYKLVNYEANKELLEKIPYEKVLDLAKVYYVSVNSEELGAGTILIYNTHLESWGITAEQLGKIAEENTPKLFPAKIDNMFNIVKELIPDSDMEISEDFTIDNCLYVVTNGTRTFGAATMLYPDTIKEFAERMESNLYILPSSVHETIVFIPSCDEDAGALKEMVHDVNRTQVSAEEVLSDSVYYYDREKDIISIA